MGPCAKIYIVARLSLHYIAKRAHAFIVAQSFNAHPCACTHSDKCPTIKVHTFMGHHALAVLLAIKAHAFKSHHGSWGD